MKIRSLFFAAHVRLGCITTAAFLLAAAVSFAPDLRAQTATMAWSHSFTRTGSDGAFPYTGVTLGSDGNFYGVTTLGGTADNGTVFKIDGSETLSTLYSFPPLPSGEGDEPYGQLIEGTAGTFYGTTYTGSASDVSAVYSITSTGTFTTLYAFNADNANPLSYPFAGLTAVKNGTYVGTTSGGNYGPGTIYSFNPASSSPVTALHTFNPAAGEGSRPYAGITVGPDGNYYGTTLGGGTANVGVVFRIAPNGTGYTTLHNFTATGDDGAFPYGQLVVSGGYLYGTTSGGTSLGYGTVFRIDTNGNLTTLHQFTGLNGDGQSPYAGMIVGQDGDLYGTTEKGGTANSGTVFVMTPAGTLTTLYSFTGFGDGSRPEAPLVQAPDGTFYGTTTMGGTAGDGTVFRLQVYPRFFWDAVALSNGVYYLAFPDNQYFGYYSHLYDPNYIYHFDLGYEYVFEANDGRAGVYLYDFKSSDFFYTSPTFPFPYLYDFNLSTVLYYYPDPDNPGHYNTNGIRYFYDFATGKIITK